MSQQVESTPEIMLEAHSTRDRVALAVSKYFSPLTAALAGNLMAAYAVEQGFATGIKWVLITLAIQILPVAVLYEIRIAQGKITDPEISHRKERNEAFLLGGITMSVAVIVLSVYNAPASVLALAASFLGIAIICGIINIWWKISMHASSIAAVATIATMQSRSLGAVFWLIVLAVAWSRLHTRNHTRGQVIAGTLLATAVVYVMYRYVVVV
jgi:membrane-associated phospholipid phosphatase